MKLYGLQFPIGKEKTHRLVAGVLSGYDGIYHLGQEQDLNEIIVKGSSSLEEYNDISLTSVASYISLIDHDNLNCDSAVNVPKYIPQRARGINRLMNQGQFQQDFNVFIETLHNCYQRGYHAVASVHLRRFAEFLGWDKEGPPIKGLDEALAWLWQAAEFNRDRGVKKAGPIYDNLDVLVTSTLPYTIFFGIPWGPNKQQTYREPLDYETIARDIMEMGAPTRS